MIEVTVQEATDYFASRLGAGEYWDSEEPNEPALTTAANDLQQSGEFSLEGVPQPQLVGAVCEQALFLLQQGSGLDTRAGLIAQGVRRAGVVEETYTDDQAGKLPIAPRARQWLQGFEIKHSGAYAGILTRDE